MSAMPDWPVPPVVDGATYRRAMRQMATAVSVLTARHGGARNGLTATAVMSVTAEPPRIAVAVNRQTSAYSLLIASGAFAVNVLRDDQVELAQRFAGGVKGEARFEGAQWTELESGAPILASAVASFDCQVERSLDFGTHMLLVGAVLAVRFGDHGLPLLYRDGAWTRLSNEAGKP